MVEEKDKVFKLELTGPDNIDVKNYIWRAKYGIQF